MMCDHAFMPHDQALATLRRMHRNFVDACGDRFADRPMRAIAVPGWVYLPVFDCVAWDGDLQ